MTEILTFRSMDEYKQWLERQSDYVKAKAEKFRKWFGDDVIPVVLSIDGDTMCEAGGAHVFIHPGCFQLIRGYIIF